MSSSEASSNNDNKRERPDKEDEVSSVACSSKALKSSDDSDQNESESLEKDESSYSVSDHPVDKEDKETETTVSTHTPDQTVEERGHVAADYVGRVIGNGGERIRDLQARSGALIDIDQDALPGQPHVVTYRGSRESVDFAKHLGTCKLSEDEKVCTSLL